MEFTIKGEDEPREASHIAVEIGNNAYRIAVTKFAELEICKVYGSEDGSLCIKPSVSKVILIT
jgi:hypothetical protein